MELQSVVRASHVGKVVLNCGQVRQHWECGARGDESVYRLRKRGIKAVTKSQKQVGTGKVKAALHPTDMASRA